MTCRARLAFAVLHPYPSKPRNECRANHLGPNHDHHNSYMAVPDAYTKDKTRARDSREDTLPA